MSPVEENGGLGDRGNRTGAQDERAENGRVVGGVFDGVVFEVEGSGFEPVLEVVEWDGAAWACAPVVGGGNTLDQAYDEGGAGAGRTLTADTGAVVIDGTGGLEVSNTITSAGSIIIDGFNDRITAASGTLDFDDENVTTSGLVESTGTGFKFPDGTVQITAVPSPCALGEVVKWNGAAWACAPDDDTVEALMCAPGEIAKWDGAAWAMPDSLIEWANTFDAGGTVYPFGFDFGHEEPA